MALNMDMATICRKENMPVKEYWRMAYDPRHKRYVRL
jgi:hypothetical protein